MMNKKPARKNPTDKKKVAITCLALSAWTMAVVFGAQFLVAYPMHWILGDNLNSPVWSAIYTALVYLLSLILIALLPWKLFKKWKTNREELGLSGLPTWTDIGLAPIGYAVSILLAYVLTAAFSFLPWFNAAEAQNVGFNNISSGLDRVVAFLALAVVAPIAEELIFRGWLYGKLRAHVNMAVSIIIVSLLFAIAHLQWNVGVTVFAMSVVNCLLREITGTIYSGTILHIIRNAIAFYAVFILGIA